MSMYVSHCSCCLKSQRMSVDDNGMWSMVGTELLINKTGEWMMEG
jgi:hypothetical protein